MNKETTAIHTVNYRSDFNLRLRLYARDGSEIGFPSCDWKAEFYTWSPANVFVASHIGGVCTNCFNDNGVIRVVFDNHRLSPGTLKVRFTLEAPDGIYPDGHERKVTPATLNVELVRVATTCMCPQEIEAELCLSLLRDSEVADAILRIVNEQLEAILGTGPADFRPAAAATNDGDVYTLQRGIISIYSRPGRLYRNLGLIRLPMGGEDERTFSLAGINTSLLADKQHNNITIDLAAQSCTATRPAGTKDGVSVLILKQDGGYLMRGTDGVIRSYDEHFAVVAERPMLPAPTIDEIKHDISSGDMEFEYERKRSRALRSGGNYILDGGGGKIRRNQWRSALKMHSLGVYRVRRRTNKRASRWVVFSFGKGRISLL